MFKSKLQRYLTTPQRKFLRALKHRGILYCQFSTKFSLCSKFAIRAAPRKLKPHGEDACFISIDGQAVGVADGIGAWELEKIDAGEYAREVMQNAKHYFEAHNKESKPDPSEAMQMAYQLSQFSFKKPGTCTVCILALHGDVLKSANMGDAGFIILRPKFVDRNDTTSTTYRILNEPQTEWEVRCKSFEMQHFFNCPVQMGSDSRNTPKNSAETIIINVAEGDLVITATDGVFDNLFVNDIISIVKRTSIMSSEPSFSHKESICSWLQKISHAVMENAIMTGLSSVQKTPFAMQASRAGFRFEGGKSDDVTVVTSLVCAEGFHFGDSN